MEKERLERGLKEQLHTLQKIKRERQRLDELIKNCEKNIEKYNNELAVALLNTKINGA